MNQKFGHIEAKKSLGQHFLNNVRIPFLMARAGNIEEGDTVLEIGPGTGVLTAELLRRAHKVIAIEADARAITVLRERFKEEIMAGKLVISHADVRAIDPSALGLHPHAYKVVANIPYYLSGMLFRYFLESETQPSDLVFLVQKEVAERIARDPKESLLSLSVKVFGTPKYIETVKKGNFTPPPNVDSAIISVSSISNEHLVKAGISAEYFFSILHEGFKSKRKQLMGNLSDSYDRLVLTHIFSTLGLDEKVRGEDIPIEIWLKLVASLEAHKALTTNPQS